MGFLSEVSLFVFLAVVVVFLVFAGCFDFVLASVFCMYDQGLLYVQRNNKLYDRELMAWTFFLRTMTSELRKKIGVAK